MIQRLFNSALLRNSQIYIIGNFINSSIPFIVLVILTRYLTPADYGTVAMFQILSGIIFPILGLSIQGAITVKYFDKDNINLPRYIGNCFLTVFLNAILVAIIFGIFLNQISKLSSIPKAWLWLTLLYSAGQVVIMVILTLFLVQAKALKYVIWQTLQNIFNVCLAILFVIWLGRKWDGMILAQTLTLIIFAVVGFIWLCAAGWIRYSYNFSYAMHALKYGIPLIPHELGGLLIMSADRFLLTNMVGIAETGVYTVGYQVANIMNIIVMSFNKAYIPWLFGKLKKNNFMDKIRIVKFTYVYFFAVIVLAVSFSLFASWVLKFIVGKNFVNAGAYIIWIALGFAFSGMYYMVTNYILLAEKTHVLAGVTFLAGTINIPLTYVLIKANGTSGAAQATTITFFIHFILTWFLSAKVYKMPWALKQNPIEQ